MPQTLDRLRTSLADRYRVERQLGEGGMATVYLAEDLKHHRPVAIKVLRPELASAIGPARFLREIEVAAGLQHPHVLPVYDSGEADGLLYYVMPFVEGESLAARLAGGPLAVPEAIRILRETADALGYAHGRGLVHRDIKPDNIMLSGGHALVADFGIARVAHEAAGSERLTATGMALGTPAYMAPEQASGETGVDHRADLYALGIVAYQMLTGELPFRAHNPQQLVVAHLTEAPDPITKFRPGLPPMLAALVMRCLEKLPADRIQSAAEFGTLLEGSVTPAAGTTPFPGAVAPVAPAAVSTPKTVVLFGLASVGVLGIVYGLMQVLGLPDWVFPAAIGLLAVGLPIMVVTSRHEWHRARGAATGFFTWRRALTGGGLAFAGLGVAVAAWMLMRVLGIGPVGTLVASGVLAEHPRVLLADFTDRSGDSTLAAAVTEAFRVDLGQSPSLELVQAAALDEAFARMRRERPRVLDLDLAREVATREGIPAVVTGEINAVGGSYVVSAQLLAAESGDVLVPARETAGDSTQILGAVDRLSRQIRERIGESIRTIRESPPLALVTTASLPALRKFSQGRRASDAGEPALAFRLFQEAIELDSTFAAAYRGLAIGLGNMGIERARRAEAMAAAFRHRNRLTEEERLWTEGSYYMNIGEFEAALGAYLALEERTPDDDRVLNNIGVVYVLQRQEERALDYYRRAYQKAPANPSAAFNVLSTSLALGRTDEAHQVVAEFAAAAPGHPYADINRWIYAWSTRAYDSAEVALDALAARRNPAAEAPLARSRLMQARLRGQPSLVDRVLATGAERARQGRQVAEYLRDVAEAGIFDAEVRGKPAEGLARVEAGLREFPLSDLEAFDRPYAELAQFYARAGNPVRARALLNEYQREVPTLLQPQLEADIAHARAFTLLAEQKPREAEAEFRRADRGMCHVCTLPGLARAWDALGNRDSVLAILQRMVDLPDDDRALVDPLELAGVYSLLGELYESRGDRDRAIEYNNRFLDLWQHAEPEFQPVIDLVRERQRRLTAERP